MIAAIVEINQLVAVDQEFKRLDVEYGFADLKHDVQVRPDDVKFRESGVFVVLVKLEKILFERADLQ